MLFAAVVTPSDFLRKFAESEFNTDDVNFWYTGKITDKNLSKAEAETETNSKWKISFKIIGEFACRAKGDTMRTNDFGGTIIRDIRSIAKVIDFNTYENGEFKDKLSNNLSKFTKVLFYRNEIQKNSIRKGEHRGLMIAYDTLIASMQDLYHNVVN